MEELFEEARTMDDDVRQDFLTRQCGSDKALLSDIEGLIAADHQAGEFIETSPLASLTRPAKPRVGQRVGAYELVRELGQGGMGTVFQAVRADQAYRGEVAIKLLRGSLASREHLRRVHAERQILARLNHPYIGRLYDGGTTADGLPYLVMELIQGEPLDLYCRRRDLPLRKRLEIFRKVCEAVRYAHQNLVVHRDLKPSNILVGEDGAPKLLDFGIAKLLDGAPPASGDETTDAKFRPLTPNYASPEQLAGDPISTRSDIYSLGVIFYRLLCGQLPRRLAGLGAREIRRRLTEETVPPLSAHGGRHLRGDLDAIAAKALRTEPEERYGSVEAFLEDLRRFTAGLPVSARRGSWSYRASKFLRRRRLEISAAALIAVLLTGATVGAILQSTRIAQERDEKEHAIQFFSEIFELVDPSQARGEELTVRQALERGAARIGQLADQPGVEAMLRETIGSVFLSLGHFAEAQSQLEHALEIRRQLDGAESVEFATTQSHYAMALFGSESYDRAAALARQAVALSTAAVGRRAPQLLTPLNNLVAILCLLEEYEEADELSQQAMYLAQDLLGEGEHRAALAAVNRAAVLDGLGDPEAAERLYRTGLGVLRHHWGEVYENHPLVATTLNNLAEVLSVREQYAEAASAHRASLAARRKAYGNGHYYVGQSLHNLASVLWSQGEVEEAEERHREAISILREHLGTTSSWTLFVELSFYQELLARNRAAEVEAELSRNLEMLRKNLPERHARYLAWAESTLGGSLVVQGRTAEARPMIERALGVLVDAYGEEDPRVLRARRWLEQVP